MLTLLASERHAIGILKACEPSISRRTRTFKRQLRSLETLNVKVFAGALHARVLAQAGIPGGYLEILEEHASFSPIRESEKSAERAFRVPRPRARPQSRSQRFTVRPRFIVIAGTH